MLKLCSSVQKDNLKGEIHVGSVYTNTSCDMVMRNQYYRDPQTLSLFRFGFVSSSETDYLIP